MRGGRIATLQHDLVAVKPAQSSLERPGWLSRLDGSATSDRGGDEEVCVSYGIAWERIDAG